IILFDIANRSGVPYPFVITLIFALVIVMLFRQLVPRLIAQNRPEQVLWALLPFFKPYHRLFYPVILPVHSVLSRMKQSQPEMDQNESEEDEAKEEIQAFIDVGEEQGIIEESEGEMIQSIVEFSDTRVAEVMKPRPQIVAIQSTATVSDARRLMMESKYSRIPVYRDQLDNIEGFIHVRDLLAFCETDNWTQPVTICMRPAYFVPESKPIAELLEEMQKTKVQTAIVIDEFGGVAGLVTIEDIVEEIVGEIEDEDRAGTQAEIVQDEDGSYLVDGRAEVKKVELLFEKDIEADDFKTVAGLIINELGHVPTIGEKLLFKGIEFEVAEADSRRVNRVRLRMVPGLPTEATQSTDERNA
ncbi:MAG: hemolysin family protein, partial [Blastocatellia bacterium]